MERSLRIGAYGRSLLISACLAAPGAAFAADNGFYVGLAASDVSSDYELGTAVVGVDDDQGFKGIVGFRPLDKLALEANYIDLGTSTATLGVACITAPCPNQAQVDSSAISVSAVGMLPLPLLDLYARVGYAKWDSDVTSSGSSAAREGSDPTYGAGAQVRVGSFALRLEWERFDFDDDSAELVSLGFTYTFL